MPEIALDGEVYVDENNRWTTRGKRKTLVFDQIQYIIDTLKEMKENPSHKTLGV